MSIFRRPFRNIGPGIITGASDDDPSGIITYSQAGAKFGYTFLWLAFFTTPLMMAIQEMSARLGLVTRRGLAALIRRYVSARVAKGLSLFLLIVNVLNIGADLGAMAAVSKLVIPAPTIVYLLFFGGLIVTLEVFIPYERYVNILKWLTLALFAYVLAAFVAHADWGAVLRGTLVPTLPTTSAAVAMVVAVLGTTLSPYLFFWQSSEEVENDARMPRAATTISSHLGRMRIDTALGMIFSNVIMFFIIVTTAATLHHSGITSIETAEQAADALRPIAGNLTFVLFSLGVIGTGLLAVPVLAGSAAYALAEVSGWSEGLSKNYRQAPGFYAVIVVAVWLGVAMAATPISPVTFLIAVAILNGLLAPVAMWFILRLADRADVVGGFRTRPIVRIAGWIAWFFMTLAGISFLIDLVLGHYA